MSNPWFRMYSEFAHDPKVQMLSETMQRRYVMLMCLRCSNALVTLHETEVAFALRISDEELASTKALFISKGFVDSEWNLLNWEKRQVASDSSAARVAKHRALKKEAEKEGGNADVTLQERSGNALDKKRLDKSREEDSSADASQKKKVSRRTAVSKDFEPDAEGMEAARVGGLNVKAELRAFIDHHDAKGSLMANWQAAWRTWVGKAIAFGHGKPAQTMAGDTSWLEATGFANVAEAQNARCHIGNAHQFRNGQRVEAHA